MILKRNTLIRSIKPFCILVCLSSLLLGCKKESVVSEDIVFNITLQSGDSYEYDFVTGEEEGALIQIQASNYCQSEIMRDQSTDMSAIYFYQSLIGYVGTDFVQIQKRTFDVSTGEEEAQVYRFNFTVE